MKMGSAGRRWQSFLHGFTYIQCVCALSIAIITGIFCLSAVAAERVALIIGNSNYKHAPKLYNPINDARGVAGVLRSAGFDVIDRYDQSARDIEDALDDFSSRLANARIGLIYFAGHGIQYRGTTYLVPVDVDLSNERDLRKTISAEYFLADSALATQLGIVILDACRDNPFVKRIAESLATTRSISLDRGLGRFKSVPKKTLIAYATQAGNVAMDGAGINSPYAMALMKHLATPGKDVRLAFGAIRDEVLKTTAGKQEPFTYASLGADEIHLVPVSGSKMDTRPVRIASLSIPNIGQLGAVSSDYLAWKQALYTQRWDPLDNVLTRNGSSYFSMIHSLIRSGRKGRETPMVALVSSENRRTTIETLTSGNIAAIQGALRDINFYSGAIDGKADRATRHALEEFSYLETGTKHTTVKTLVRLGELAATREATSGLTGTWSGRYEYPIKKRRGVDFSMKLIFSQGLITGSIIEPNTFGSKASRNLYAHFKGTVTGNQIRWVKKYDGTGGVDHIVIYEGKLDRAAQTVTGKWKIPGNWSGAFSLRRER